MIISFIVCLVLFTLIGVASVCRSKGSNADYYVASQQIKAWLVGLSAVATNNSGYMFIGVIGYTYSTGFAAIWLMIGWILGDFIASLFAHKHLRIAAEASSQQSYPGVLSFWNNKNHWFLRRLIGGIAFIFLITYAAAQLVAGSKALFVLFDWPLWAGAIIGAGLIVIYCMAGGIRASIWTDAAQSFVMIFAMIVLLVSAVSAAGGPADVIDKMAAIPEFTNLLPSGLLLPGISGLVLFVLGWVVAGLSVIGQPHIMVRFMTLDDPKKMKQAKVWYYLWFIAFYCAATGVGLLARIILPEVSTFDPELALPTMAESLLHPWMVGLVLAAIFAATMSTADSLVLSCSSVITCDLSSPDKAPSALFVRLATVGVAACALLLAMSNNDSVFQMVVFAWSGLGSSFAPLLIARCLKWNMHERFAVVAVVSSLLVVVLWRVCGLHNHLYEGLPAIIVGMIILGIAHKRVGVNNYSS